MAETYDAIVLGVGGFGSGALYHLAKRGLRVLGIERFDIAHDRGSSHGETRIIRKAYFEHPDYVPLLRRAYDLWDELERESGRKLLHKVGLFIAGRPDCESVSGTLLAARLHQLSVEKFDAAAARRRFPGYAFPDDFVAVFESEAGYLEVENCVSAHVATAQLCGAEVRTGETVVAWKADGQGVTVRTDRGEYSAGSLVITGGPWAAQILNAAETLSTPDSSMSGESTAVPWWDRLRVIRKVLFWFPAESADNVNVYDVDRGNSTFFFETDVGQFYGFPCIDGHSVKLAEHTGGELVDDPLMVDRGLHPADRPRVQDFVREYLPALGAEPIRHAVCMYTKTPDSHFCIDKHPEYPDVVIGAGFSGHGFKFTSVLGEALADLATAGETRLPVGFLSARRFF